MSVMGVQVKIQTFKEWSAYIKNLRAKGTTLFLGEHRRSDDSSFPVEVNSTLVQVSGREFLLASVRDISERLRMEETVRELKTLRGLVPMCARCKKIRNDKGYWEQVETYIENRSDARFTHGICEKCSKELYGKEDWFKTPRK